jgi:hypothetical protein
LCRSSRPDSPPRSHLPAQAATRTTLQSRKPATPSNSSAASSTAVAKPGHTSTHGARTELKNADDQPRATRRYATASVTDTRPVSTGWDAGRCLPHSTCQHGIASPASKSSIESHVGRPSLLLWTTWNCRTGPRATARCCFATEMPGSSTLPASRRRLSAVDSAHPRRLCLTIGRDAYELGAVRRSRRRRPAGPTL